MKISGHVHVNLDVTDEHTLLRRVQDAAFAPPGADVTFTVRPRQCPSYQGLAWLREHGKELGSVTFECSDPETVTRWVAGLRGDHLW